jgi:TM2 domain-containing membrane protein YozV
VVIQTAAPVSNVSPKSKGIALFLCGFFGMLGFHKFYLGRIFAGILMFICTVSIILSWITAIWVIYDIIVLIFSNPKDSEGRELEW